MGFRMSTVHSGSFAEDMQVEFTADRTCAEVLVKWEVPPWRNPNPNPDPHP